MTGPERLVPRAMDGVDGVRWEPLDDPNAVVIAHRPDEQDDAEFPITLRFGRNPARRFPLSREEARRLGTVLLEADEVAGGAA